MHIILIITKVTFKIEIFLSFIYIPKEKDWTKLQH